MKSSIFGILALLFGVVALGLAAIPRIAIERPNRLTSTDELPRPIDSRPTRSAESEIDGSLTFEIGKFTVTVGDAKPEVSPAEQHRQQVMAYQNAAIDRQLARREATISQFTFAANGCAVLGLLLGTIAWVREKQRFLAGSAICVCILALFLESIVLAIATAMVIMLVILFLVSLVC